MQGRSIWITVVGFVSFVGVVAGWIPQGGPLFRPLPAAIPNPAAIIGESNWRADAFVNASRPSEMRRFRAVGSWVDGDAFTGEHVTDWYRAKPDVAVMVTGYPTLAGNALTMEIRHTDGRITAIPFLNSDPGERWAAWSVSLPRDASALRLRAVDGSSTVRGWLGFCEPYANRLSRTVSVRMVAQTFGSVALSLVLIVGPGLAWRAWRGGSILSLLWVGPTLLAAGGLTCWSLGGFIPVSVVALVWISGTLGALAWVSTRHPPWQTWSRSECGLLALVSLCVLGAAAKAAFSGGPEGELYGGYISRTLEIGGHSDSRVSYHTVQLIAHHLSPHEPEGQKYFAPWSFSSRGPLAGLVAAPVVLATGGKPPLEMPDQPWAPFDFGGFATYRIVVGTCAALALVAVFGLLLQVTDERRAFLGAALLALAPFFWHELYFSWPKMMTAAWVVGAFALLLDGRWWTAGLALGAAYLWHPLALLSAPFFCLWPLGERARPFATRIRTSVLVGLGALVVPVAWQLVNAGHVTQGGFLHYFHTADEADATLQTWLASRWNNLANTLVPLHVWLVNSTHRSFNALGIASDRWTQFCLQYWTAAPFAAGLVASTALAPALFRNLVCKPAVASVAVVGPLVFLVVYWGGASTGLMREAGHVIFLSGWIFLVWAPVDQLPRWTSSWWFLGLRGAEVLGMMLIPALVPEQREYSHAWVLNDALWLTVLFTTVVSVVVAIRKTLASAHE